MRFPFWCRLSLVIILGIGIGSWFAGETTRQLDTEYLFDSMRRDMQRTTGLLAGLIIEPVITGDETGTNAIIRQYAAAWPEVSYIHVMDDEGYAITEWQKKPIHFGPNVRKFEQPVVHGGQEFGILSIYVDIGDASMAVEEHVAYARRQSALVLLSLTMFVVFFTNYFAVRRNDNAG